MAAFDLIVIGGGPGGYVAAIRAAQLGLKVACAEKSSTLGGTCLNVGCIPSKALLHASALFAEAREGSLEKFGIRFREVTLDLAAMMAEKAKAVAELTRGIEFLFRKNGVVWLKGTAAFVDPHAIKVAGERHEARHLLIATGSEPAFPPGLAPDGEVVVTSTEALAFDRVPRRLLVVGGGYIGLELGSVWRRLGAEVVVVEVMPTILPAMDPDVVSECTRLFRRQGLKLHTSTKVAAIERVGEGARVALEPEGGGPAEVVDADRVLLAVGRRPYTQGLALERAGLAVDERGRLPVDGQFRTAVPHIRAIGDVTAGPMLAHRAMDEGHAAAEWIAGRTGHVDRAVIPAVVYTHPEIAAVGLSEPDARAAGHDVRVGRFPFAANSRAKANRDTDGFVKIVADAATDRVLGVHIVGAVAGTLIAEAAQAMALGASSEDIALTCHAHPTHAEALKEAAIAVRGPALHA
ncbi:MAG: dihydrolipoyl dehydrogenase [Sphingomonadaceae bacterium]|uniref:dihydrolipoyl dehydrogenase n=1 Tax=Thermaurantiacus sp. TaxID=2820283 RepID=UPI00298ED3EE|nr:dihydrolipoyl dehydrogenase [Thermaurantiacus sp.]MCS6985944.1 dihydrolipoyl dehydrogenase [Sphingomonadaceae bacterium]MDW8414840.1 dihydrolipoyl dehydrogenase [Thermaurantiacus sp.]